LSGPALILHQFRFEQKVFWRSPAAVFFTVMFLPVAFLNGLFLVYVSSVWTLTYREMKALESIQPPAPVEAPAEVK